MKKKTKRYSLLPEHKAQLKPWADKWIDIILNTNPISEEEKNICRKAIKDLYQSANLESIPDRRIVFVKSPIQAAFVAAVAQYVWWARDYNKNINGTNKTDVKTAGDATERATRDATEDATRSATVLATVDAAEYATDEATRKVITRATLDATIRATGNAAMAATWGATANATERATWGATMWATVDATEDATRDAAERATRDATGRATGNAAMAATWEATVNAAMEATALATREATWGATANATERATWGATMWATVDATWDATKVAITNMDNNWYIYPFAYMSFINKIEKKTNNNLNIFLKKIINLYSGGNFWGPSLSYLTFFRYIAKLNIDYTKFDAYEKLGTHSNLRFMHKKFCIISDRPEFIKMDESSRPHCEDGPYIKWRDGTAFYAVHGVFVPMWIIEKPNKITIEKIEQEGNAEIRRIMIDKYGIGKYIIDSGSIKIHEDEFGILYKKEVRNDEPIIMVKVINSTPEQDGTSKSYWLRVPPNISTAEDAIAWTFGFEGKSYKPIIET